MTDTPTLTLWEFDDDDWDVACPRCMHADGVYIPMEHGGRERTFKLIDRYRDVPNRRTLNVYEEVTDD